MKRSYSTFKNISIIHYFLQLFLLALYCNAYWVRHLLSVFCAVHMRKDPTVYILRFSLYCIRYLMYLMYRFQTLIHIIVLLSCLVVFSIHYFQILFCCLELFCQLNRLQDGLRVQSYQYSILNLYYFFNLDCKDIQINVKYLIILSRITVTKACNVNYKKTTNFTSNFSRDS